MKEVFQKHKKRDNDDTQTFLSNAHLMNFYFPTKDIQLEIDARCLYIWCDGFKCIYKEWGECNSKHIWDEPPSIFQGIDNGNLSKLATGEKVGQNRQ